MENESFYQEQFQNVNRQIREAALRSGRRPEDITLLSVTKTQPVEVMEIAWKLGMRVAGENHVQEILEKKRYFGDRLAFHMIGHLQRNKVRQVLGQVELFIPLTASVLPWRLTGLQERWEFLQKC